MEFDMKNQWTKNADAIMKYAMEQNRSGKPFPIFFTCLGFQLAAYLTSNYDNSVLSRVHGDDAIVLPLDLTGKESYLMKTFTETQISNMTKGHGLMYYNHNWAVTVTTFNQNSRLKSFWDLIATTTTPYNEDFVAMMEAKDYPFFGVQFHP